MGLITGAPFILQGHEEKTSSESTYVCPMCPDIKANQPGKCPKCGMNLVLGGSKHNEGNGHNTTAPTIKAEIIPLSKNPSSGKDTPTILRLTDSKGNAVKLDDLNEAHTKKIHLLIIDESMSDYHHEHPEPTDRAGEYRFVFKPKYGGLYHFWADLDPKSTGKQEYARTELKVDGKAKQLVETENTTITVDGYKFDLSVENNLALKAGQPAMLIVKITKPDGQPANNLEPIMAAFAHGVGFPRTLDSVMHVHPMGKEPEKDSDRGGPELKFHIVPEKPGWLKFYAQVQINGNSKFAGFGLKVSP